MPFDPAEMEFVDNLSELERLPKIPKSISLGDQMGKLRLGQVPGPPSRQSHDREDLGQREKLILLLPIRCRECHPQHHHHHRHSKHKPPVLFPVLFLY